MKGHGAITEWSVYAEKMYFLKIESYYYFVSKIDFQTYSLHVKALGEGRLINLKCMSSP